VSPLKAGAPERRTAMPSSMIVRVVALALAVVVVGFIIMRRRSHKSA
jgi:hypothetical protein